MSKKSRPTIRADRDTRGLTIYQDPRRFYEYSSQRKQEQATGIEGLLYKWISLPMFAKTAYAIDPFRALKMSESRITPAGRVRNRKLASVLDQQIFTYRHESFVLSPPVYVSGYSYHSDTQTPLTSTSTDTTRRTRLPGSDMGEFSKWEAYTDSPGRSTRYEYTNDEWYGAPPPGVQMFHQRDVNSWTYSSPAATINGYWADQIGSDEMNNALVLMQKRCIAMYSGITPQKRQYTLFRNIVELKDVSRGILTLKDSYQKLFKLADTLKIPGKARSKLHDLKTTLDQVPKEYVSYWFGWHQLYSDTIGLLTSPLKIAKKIDFMVRRNGLATTYRTFRDIEEHGVPSIGFQYGGDGSYTSSTSNSFTRKTRLKMVVNTTFSFPPTDLPNFKKNEFLRQLGLAPTPVDLYNLVPWTWLFDWFTGFGNYLEVIENVNSDSSLINWGFITAKVDYELRTEYVSKLKWFRASSVVGHPGSYDEPIVNYNHVSKLHGTLQLRKDLSTIMDVKTISNPENFSPYQISILGAIIYNGTRFRRSGK